MDARKFTMQDVHLLIIEDDEEDVLILREILANIQDINISQKYADNLSNGLKLLESNIFDVAFLDLGLPECSGRETIEKLKEHTFDTAIIVMTGLNDNEMAEKALSMGMDDYLVKGTIDPSVLSRSIRYAIQRKKNKMELQEKEAYYRGLISRLHEDIIVIDQDYNITDINNSFMQTTGMKRQDVIGEKCYRVTHSEEQPCSNSDFPCYLQKVFKTGGYAKCVHKYIKSDGTERFVDLILSPMKNENGEVIRVIEAARDITEFLELNLQLQKSLKEKEVLLTEVHHRVKNNMQIINSLLKMEAQSINNQEASKCLMDSRNRVKTMSLIHELLYKSTDFTHIDFENYIKQLSRYLFRVYMFNPNKVKLGINIKNIDVNIIIAIPLGLIINELLSNSLKYAFPNNRDGTILISVVKVSNNKLHLIYQDDGDGFPKGFDYSKTDTMGMQLIYNLSAQLQGTPKFVSNKGVQFELKFNHT